MFTVSVIIPTFIRMRELDEALTSILNQSYLPREVIIIDDSDSDNIEQLVFARQSQFCIKSVNLKYFKNHKMKSLTIARNLGVARSSSDIIMFLDDDVLLAEDYIKKVLDVFSAYPDARGVQGYWANDLKMSWKDFLSNFCNRLFYGFYYEKNGCRVLPSFHQTYPYDLNKVIHCEWLSGCNCSFLRSCFNEFEFDERLKSFAPGEDLDFSYRIYKKYPHSLYITPEACLSHKASSVGRPTSRIMIDLYVVYYYYLFNKNMAKSFKNRIAHTLNLLGMLAHPLFAHNIAGLQETKLYFNAIIFCLTHKKEIVSGNFDNNIG